MKHQGKQAIAWALALTAASSVYAGGGWWMKRLASNHNSGHGDEHEESADHESPGHEAASEDSDSHHGDTAKKDEHGSEHGAEDKDTGHKEEHAAAAHADSEHKKDEHVSAHEEKPKAPEHHANTHGDKADEHKKADSHADTKTAEKPAKAHDGGAPHWSYLKSDPTGPSSWGNLNEQFAQCEKGREQSPIDIKGAVSKASAPHITWHYSPVAVNVENNGHTIVAGMPNTQNHITIDSEKYTLAQFHFHNPSEHKIGGIPADMELHLVHKNDKGALAVIGVMIHEKAGDENPFFKPLWSILPRTLHSKAESTPTINLTKLLPTHRDYFHYAGSLTTPPCSQGVRWFVLKDPVTMNGSQVELYSGIFDTPTNRPVQPMFGREIIQSSGPATVAH